MLDKEVLTTAVGMEASRLFDIEEKQGKFRFWINRLLARIAKLFGINETVARKLAGKMVKGDIDIAINADFKLYEQHQKDELRIGTMDNLIYTHTRLLENKQMLLARFDEKAKSPTFANMTKDAINKEARHLADAIHDHDKESVLLAAMRNHQYNLKWIKDVEARVNKLYNTYVRGNIDMADVGKKEQDDLVDATASPLRIRPSSYSI